jgi:hypothetical protein
MNKYHKILLLNLLIYACVQSTVSASETEWNLYTSKDELTGKTSNPYLIYKAQIPGNSKGIIEIKIACFDESTKYEVLNSKLSIYNAPILEVTRDSNWNNFYESRILNADGSVITQRFNQDKKYQNVFHGQYLLSEIKSNYSNLPKKQEFIFDGGNNKILVEFGMKYSNYVKSCLREKEREDKQRVLQLQREDRQRELQLQKEKELARKKQTEYLNELLIELNEGKSPRKDQYFIDK